MWRRLLTFDRIVVGLSLLLILALRAPSFFEPYWYGDEAIYLTIGQSLNRGAVLYRDIIDHKTPLIYLIARVGSQEAFRCVLTVSMLITNIFFYFLLKKFTNSRVLSALGLLLFVLMTSLPAYEGTIPNGELFVLALVIPAVWVIVRFLPEKWLWGTAGSRAIQVRWSQLWAPTLASGVLLGLAILTKVPALFDALAAAFLGWLTLSDAWVKGHFHWQNFRPAAVQALVFWLALIAGVLIPIVLSILFFWQQGALYEYLQYGLLYNFHYFQSWQPFAGNPVLSGLFSLPVKVGVLAAALLSCTVASFWVSRKYSFAVSWYWLALFAILLSNRPYPHYFLQLAPPLVLVICLIAAQLMRWFTVPTINHRGSPPYHTWLRTSMIMLIITMVSFGVTYSIHQRLGVQRYPTVAYYQRFWRHLTGSLSTQDYLQSFNSLQQDNYALTTQLRTDDSRYLYVWGTNPALYALTRKQPADAFTVSFHVKDVGSQAVAILSVRQKQPRYIVVMNDETEQLPGLQQLLAAQYRPTSNYEHFQVYVWQD